MNDDDKSADHRGQPGRRQRRRSIDGDRTEGRMQRLRIRAAWMYYVEQKTQNAIAEVLDVGRITVVRLLADARARNEVRISIQSPLAAITYLERQLELKFGIGSAIVAPLSDPDADPVPAISAATGYYISTLVASGMRVGVGWGQTLFNSLPYLTNQKLENFSVVSLLGGISEARRYNPTEFAWQFAQTFQGEGFLLPAPAIVDSARTKHALIENCGLNEIFKLAETLDLAIVSVGTVKPANSTYRVNLLSEDDRNSLVECGAVGDLLFHYYNADAKLLDHPINHRVMSVGIEQIRKTPARLLSSGGPGKIEALLAALKLIEPTIFITDEQSAHRLLQD
ncbi:transcriptional regulator [hydrothermal vent metagenome]|uniref:Transcriptional regulator n=1 Tax=hydrothermal vent metagenome TaxID=652676 RepID=A0A3B0THU4_9ZZZZ